MEEGKIEKIFAKKEKEKTILEKLVEFKKNEEKKMEEDKLHPGAWRLIDPRKLTKGNQDLYASFEGGDFEAAQNRFKVAKIEAEKIKNPEERMSNISFLQWIDDEIELARLKEQSQEQQQKDNL